MFINSRNAYVYFVGTLSVSKIDFSFFLWLNGMPVAIEVGTEEIETTFETGRNENRIRVPVERFPTT